MDLNCRLVVTAYGINSTFAELEVLDDAQEVFRVTDLPALKSRSGLTPDERRIGQSPASKIVGLPARCAQIRVIALQLKGERQLPGL